MYFYFFSKGNLLILKTGIQMYPLDWNQKGKRQEELIMSEVSFIRFWLLNDSLCNSILCRETDLLTKLRHHGQG